MTGFRLPSWQRLFRRGARALTRHRDALALELLTAAAAACPVSRPRQLARILRSTGFACARLGHCDAALQCWRAAQQAWPDPRLARLLQRRCNEYGMARQAQPLEDDWRAFHSLHMARYLRGKHSPQLSPAEADMLRDLLWDHFATLSADPAYACAPAAERRTLFAQVRIAFPQLLPVEPDVDSQIVPVDFVRRQRVAHHDRCPCGSSLSYGACCGRIPGPPDHLVGA